MCMYRQVACRPSYCGFSGKRNVLIEIRIEVLSGEAKIHDIDMLIVSGRANKQVFGLEVTMDIALVMDIF